MPRDIKMRLSKPDLKAVFASPGRSKATSAEIETARTFTRIRKEPGSKNWSAWLVIGDQSFKFIETDEGKIHASWFCWMMAKALESFRAADAGFAQGVVYACARLIEMRDEPTFAIEILNESGITTEQMRRCADYDLKFLRMVKPDHGQPQPKEKVPRTKL